MLTCSVVKYRFVECKHGQDLNRTYLTADTKERKKRSLKVVLNDVPMRYGRKEKYGYSGTDEFT